MIYVDFNGRCGDQFFQYAFARKIQLAIKNSEELQFNFYNEKRWRDKLNDDSFRNDLQFFNVFSNNSFVSDVENIEKYGSNNQVNLLKKYRKISGFLKKFNMRRLAKYFHKKMQKNGIYYDDMFFELYCYPRKENNVFIRGYFENYKYYYNDEKLIDILQKELTPKQCALCNDSLLHLIKTTNSVCLSMRSWGEVSNFAHIIQSRQVCGKEYYLSAIRIIKEKYPDATLVVFSDDIGWAKKTLGDVGNVLFENKCYNICEKITLMSSCKHFIISNSSFSWWTQFLSSNKEKTIISPDKWYNDKDDVRVINPNWVIVKASQNQFD